MKILTILGARPQFIKAATISRAIFENNKNTNKIVKEIIVHTGQHYDSKMSDIFFDQMNIPLPDYNLGISNLSHGAMTGRMIEEIERLLLNEKPDCVLVYGDTNSTLAGAIAAAKLCIPIAHVEAGLRSNNMAMPEEVNRVLTDRLANYLFCPTIIALDNLKKEGFPFDGANKEQQHLENIGDVMYDAMLFYKQKAMESVSLDNWQLADGKYALCTLHRQENTDNPQRLESILNALNTISKNICQVVLPLHPRTKKQIEAFGYGSLLKEIKILEPIAYFEMLRLQCGARMILTDSGGVQKEAFFHGVSCITLREETEWVETLEGGSNRIVGSITSDIINAASEIRQLNNTKLTSPYGKGTAAIDILNVLNR